MKNQREKIRQEALMYIRLMNRIIDEVNKSEGVMEPERKKILTAKVIKYKKKIEELQNIWTTHQI